MPVSKAKAAVKAAARSRGHSTPDDPPPMVHRCWVSHCKTIISYEYDVCPYHRGTRIVSAKLDRSKFLPRVTSPAIAARRKGIVAIASHFSIEWAFRMIQETRMTTLIYVHSEGRLHFNFIAGTSLDVVARSGPWGKGVAPVGGYTVSRPVPIEATTENSPYTDAMGFAWFAKITPRFTTERSGFGIHPDGNVPGTRGCIGIAIRDTKPIFNFLTQAAEPLILFVVK